MVLQALALVTLHALVSRTERITFLNLRCRWHSIQDPFDTSSTTSSGEPFTHGRSPTAHATLLGGGLQEAQDMPSVAAAGNMTKIIPGSGWYPQSKGTKTQSDYRDRDGSNETVKSDFVYVPAINTFQKHEWEAVTSC